MKLRLTAGIFLTSLIALPVVVSAQSRITTPFQQFGHNIGDDYFLANYKQLT